MDEVERILQQRGRERRALGERYMSGSCCSEEPGANLGCCPDTLAQRSAAAYVSTASRAEPDDALDTLCPDCRGKGWRYSATPGGGTIDGPCPRGCPVPQAPIGERDLAYALEEALLHDGDRRRALAVLILWKEQERA